MYEAAISIGSSYLHGTHRKMTILSTNYFVYRVILTLIVLFHFFIFVVSRSDFFKSSFIYYDPLFFSLLYTDACIFPLSLKKILTGKFLNIKRFVLFS